MLRSWNGLKKRDQTPGRTDDTNEQIVRNRIEVYKSETTPVFDYYARQEKSHSINGIGEVDEIFNLISAVIDTL